MRSKSLQTYPILFERVPDGERAVDPNSLGQRSKLGGKPDWSQTDETPICSDCDKEMKFVGQLDSIEHDSKTNPHRINALSKEAKYMFGDVGMIYIFFCFECSAAQAIFQC